MTNKSIEDWERDFDEKFLSGHHWNTPEGQSTGKDFANKSIKPFITSLVQKAKEDERERIIRIIKSKQCFKSDMRAAHMYGSDAGAGDAIGRKSVLTELLDSL